MFRTYPAQKIRIPPLILLGTAVALASIHLGLNLKLVRYSHLAISFVFWLAIASTISDKYRRLPWESDLFSCGLGTLAIALSLGAVTLINRSLWLGFAPVFLMLGLALLASGIKNLRCYLPELIIMLTLGIPKLLLPLIPDISPITAKFSAFWLFYSGFNVVLDGTKIILTNGAVEVVPSCSGLNLILYMLSLAVVFLVMFPLAGQTTKMISLSIAAVIGFLVNSIRVALLALLAGDSSRSAFEYWHSQDGALIFVVISVLLYGFCCWLLLRHRLLHSTPN
ncbi:MAG: cyanoexosortase A [Cyanobacteria bacterium J06555_3]